MDAPNTSADEATIAWINVATDSDLKRRVRVAAAKEGKSMSAWMVGVVEKALADGEGTRD